MSDHPDASNIRPGLASVTFRHLPVDRVVTLACNANLTTIEWGGDVHVPPGDFVAARRVRRICGDAGLAIGNYGSYYRAGGDGPDHVPFAAVLETALDLGAPGVRVWAGSHGSAVADADTRRRVRDDLVVACDLAAASAMGVELEYHGDTLTDTVSSTVLLLQTVGRHNLRSYWQPRHGDTAEAGVRDLSLLRPDLGDLHVFHWWPDLHSRRPLADGADCWQAYLRAAADGKSRVAALEFVRGDDEAQLARDAATLHSLLRDLQETLPGRCDSPKSGGTNRC